MRWQGDLPFVQGRRFISDPKQGHFFLDLLNAEQKMELDPKPDEYLIANASAQPHAGSSLPPADTHAPSHDAALSFKRVSIFFFFLSVTDQLLQNLIMWFVFLMTF